MTTGLLYGSPYSRASRQNEEDLVSMLSPVETTTPEQSYPINHRKPSSEDGMSQRTPSWLVSPPEPQDLGLYEQQRVSSPTPNMGFSVFGDRARSQSPYQEQVAWANSTQFRSAPAEPKPQMVQTTFLTTDEEAPPQSHRYFRHPRHMLEPWMAGVWIRFPWWGAGALFLVVLLTGASAGILLASHGTTVDDWKVGHDNAQPHVYISVFEMAMNFLILFALVEGVVLRFWRQLLHGTTLDSIHDTYESMYLWSAIKRIVRLNFNLVAVACIVASVSFSRGPLFHRALTIVDNSIPVTGYRTLPIYHISSLLVALGVVFSLIGVVAVVPLYYGFWEMGRKVSLNPLEIARAFGAPFMEGLDGNTTPDMISVERGGMGVKYGALDRYGEQKKLRVEESGKVTVRMPWQGEIFE
ncbi:uncharacterized protein CC84DRAFT_1137177 [Paraphaeosphaeria sporulosa]|uniref:Uncharacterized protein n=1 Tax=Paraphaeosphaeria sporulosa TaxID=1460663 RepID=A0A177CPN7_9PLEO|nr:uncharacterized protein CC84DRAFT_1137177 [Paraphaeosphaeria sporulosa]OAG09483.1 hypothetical protein CC84DRAFT_1137177 [Paraphaeosphaeria sporulosa]